MSLTCCAIDNGVFYLIPLDQPNLLKDIFTLLLLSVERCPFLYNQIMVAANPDIIHRLRWKKICVLYVIYMVLVHVHGYN